MEQFNLREHPHRRYNPLTGEWVLVSPHRTRRPWQGQVEKTPPEVRPVYDPQCYLCPGNSRAGGEHNPHYEHTFVFVNDFAALMPVPVQGEIAQDDLLRAVPVQGVCRVLCFSPRHDLTLAEMPLPDIRLVVDAWAQQTAELGDLPYIGYVQIFENRGAMMGASNPHPHGQIWATQHVLNEPAKEARTQAAYLAAHGSPLLLDYLALEEAAGERIVCANEHFVALVPFWAIWPFETMVLPRRQVVALPELSPAERDALADILKQLTTRYDNLFEVSFPYSMGWHQRPVDGSDYPGWVLHAHFYPPLLRSATVRKFLVGFEMLGEPQRDIPAEAAASAAARRVRTALPIRRTINDDLFAFHRGTAVPLQRRLWPAGNAAGARAPGRVNVIGEHTDYNDGFVLPAAITRETRIVAAPRSDGQVHLVAQDLQRQTTFDLANLHPAREERWGNYVRGVAAGLLAAGYPVTGMDALMQGDVPIGAGLSSSAAVEMVAVQAFSAAGGFTVPRDQAAASASMRSTPT